jgi:hypothetical protein
MPESEAALELVLEGLRARGRAEVGGVAAFGVRGDVLRFHPESDAALLVFVNCAGDADDPRQRFVLSVESLARVIDEARDTACGTG